MEQTVVDGVPVRWVSGPAPLRAGLVFGVGRRDETFARGGLTHLVEHLTMSALGRTTLDCNASVDLVSTEFTASGRPEKVAEFLRRVCEALSSLPVERLAVEADVLRTEDGVVAHPVVGALLAERYGASGAGLGGFQEPALLSLTAADVREWAARYFVRGNAALWLSGPPPEGLSLPLPHGAAPSRPRQRLLPRTTPALVTHPLDGAVALGADVPRLPGLAAACRVLRERVEDDLRHRRGLSYTVDVDTVLVGEDRRFVAVHADCRDGQEAVAARALWQGLGRLADEGPSEQELAHEQEGLVEYLADPRATVDEVQAAASGLVTGVPHRTGDELREEAAALTREQVADAARAVRDGALLGVPAEAEVGLPGLTPVPQWSPEVVEGQVFARRRVRSDAPRGSRLIVGEQGVSVVLRPGEQITVRYADAVALLELGPDEWTLVGSDGFSVPLAPGDWRHGERALELVRAAVPAHLQVAEDSTRAAARRVLLLHAPPHAANEAIWPSRRDAWISQNERWTLLVREQDDEDAYADAAGLSAALGRRHAVLLLEQEHDELLAVVLHRGKERDRHLWTGEEHDPQVLAELLGADPAELARVLASAERPPAVLGQLTQVLGVPEQVGDVLAGRPLAEIPGLVHERARGVRESFASAVRGEFDPPESNALHHRISRWERERPAGYRAANGAAAAGQVALAVVLAAQVDSVASWPAALAVLFGVGALGSLWSARPPKH